MTRLARQVVVAAAAAALAAGCSRDATSTTPATSTSMPPIKTYLTQGPFDRTPDGQSVDLITLRNQVGVEVRIMPWGATILSLKTPDRAGALDDVTLGFDTFAPYVTKSPYFGAVVGRYGNRIAKGKFTLDGQTYTLATNNGANHLHGGDKGFDKKVWKADTFQNVSGVGVKLTYASADGEEGYPGTLTAEVTYTLTDKNQLIVDYHATTDKATVLNLTQHTVLAVLSPGPGGIAIPSLNNGTGFPDYTISGFDLNRGDIRPGDQIIFFARITGANDGPDSFFLVPQAVPGPVLS